MKEPLPRIPAPTARAFRRLRFRFLPFVVYGGGMVAAAILWTRWVAPPTVVAEAEAVHTEVRAPQHGSLAGMNVAVMQSVVAGQTLAHVITNDVKIVQASLAVLCAELEVMRATMKPLVDQQRVALDFERLQLDWMSERVKLASLQAQLQMAESTLTRTTALYQNKMVTDERFEEATTTREALRQQVKAQTELIMAFEPRLRGATPDGHVIPSGAEALRAAIKLHEEKLRLAEAQLSPVPLIAPIDGFVTHILRRPGETITVGEPVLQITAERSERLVGYLRQPVSAEPKPGMTVRVRTRTPDRRVGVATVVEVGRHMEPIPSTLLAAMRLTDAAERGLRVHVTPPAGLALRPGEHVDVVIGN